MTRSQHDQHSVPLFGRWWIDLSTGQLTWSEELLAMFDAGVSNPVDVSAAFDRVHPEDRDALEERLAIALVTPGPISGQYRFSTIHRGQRVFAFVGDVERDAAGEPTRLAGYSIDVSAEMREATREAVDAATRHRRAIEQVKGALMISYRIDEVTAFGLLRTQSNEHNVKINELAEHVSRAMSQGTARSLDDGSAPMLEVMSSVARRLQTGEGADGEDGLPEAN